MNYFDTQGIPFRPAVRVKPLSRFFDPVFRVWFVECRVTSRREGEYGTVRMIRASELYATQGVRRGMCGRLYWADRMTDAALLALPEVKQ